MKMIKHLSVAAAITLLLAACTQPTTDNQQQESGTTNTSQNVEASLTIEGDEPETAQMGGSLTIEENTDTNMETDDATVKTYTLAEVAENDSEESCWIALDGKVYDATPFIGDHPGGEAILKGCGKDHTEEWNAIPPHENAGPKLEDLYIGKLSE